MMCPYCLNTVQENICPHCGRDVHYKGRPNHLPVGYTLIGQHPYVLGAAIGQGGFGITYIAMDTQTNLRVAIKEYFPTHCCGRSDVISVYPNLDQEETFGKGKVRFLDEARMLKSLSDLSSVVNVLDFFETNNTAYLVMEYLDGCSLKDHVEKYGKMPAQQFFVQLKPLMADMEKMHIRGVVHRDIAPDNIIFLPDGRLKLIDFGAARSYVGDKSMTVVVKKGFAPVEQYMRKGSNASTDVYALAATIYYCITGIIPPDSAERQYGEAELQAPTVLGIEISRAQERILEKALEIQPKDRTQTIGELAGGLAQAPKAAVPKREKAVKEKAVRAKTVKEQTPKAAEPKSDKSAKWLIPMATVIAAACIVIGFLCNGKQDPAVYEEPVQMEAVQDELQPTVPLSAEAIKYNEAVDLFNSGEYGRAAIAFGKLGDYRDAKEVSFKIWDAIAVRNTISIGSMGIVIVQSDGTVVSKDLDTENKLNFSEWTDIIAISISGDYAIGLRSDGTVVATGENREGRCNVSAWTDIVAVCASGDIALGLRSDGTVVAAGSNKYGQSNVSEWTDVVAFIVDESCTPEIRSHAVAMLRSDGTAMIVDHLHDTVEQWTDIQAISAGWGHTVGLRNDGTVLERVSDTTDQCDVSAWTDIVKVVAADRWRLDTGGHVVGLRRDGTVVATGNNKYGQCDVGEWTDIVDVIGGPGYTLGIHRDGTIFATGEYRNKAHFWTGYKRPADRDKLLSRIHLKYITDEGAIDPEMATYTMASIASLQGGKSDTVEDPFWGGTVYPRGAITSVAFRRLQNDMPADAWDVSEARDRSILAWVTDGELTVASNGNIALNSDASDLFYNFMSLTDIDFGDCTDTAQVTDMSRMFMNCYSLQTLDLSSFNTEKVMDMSEMFSACKLLDSLDLTGFDTANVRTMESMFRGCCAVPVLDLHHFNTENVTTMNSMFLACYQLKNLDISNFDTASVTSMSSMFRGCSELTSLDLRNFDTSKVTAMDYMFNGCSKLTYADLSNFDTSEVTNMHSMFDYCETIPTLDLRNFDVSNVEDMGWMFANCYALKRIEGVYTWKVSGSADTSYAFYASPVRKPNWAI